MDLDAPGLERAAAQLPSEGGATVAADVASPAGHADAVQAVTERFGGFDAWVNNAGLARHAAIAGVTKSQIDLMMQVNLKGTVLGSQAAMRCPAPMRWPRRL